MTGTIKSCLESKGYGFIKGDNNIDYFFHYSSIKQREGTDSIEDGKRVVFEEKATPKGYSAINIVLLQTKEESLYEYPSSTLFSKSEHVNGWETIDSSDWYVEESSKESPEDAKQRMLYHAKLAGANAVVNALYFKTTGQEGNYKFTVHNYKGQLVRIARKTSGQGMQKENMLGLDSDISSFKRSCVAQAEKINARQKKIRNKIFTLLIAVSVIVYLLPLFSKTIINMPTTIWSVIIAIAGIFVYFFYPTSEKVGDWLYKSI